mmetsp:Transcript_42493/g.70667  ORF Transcript_42493/g.70667 Transcript_42493/m.70667 type:complete len:542 (-) Transcript_42493:436-2061(-)
MEHYYGAETMHASVQRLARTLPRGASHPTVAATFVTLQLGATAIRYAVCSMCLPLSEVLTTFLEDLKLPRDAYALAYEGTVVPPHASATALGLLPASGATIFGQRRNGLCCIEEGEAWVVSPPDPEKRHVNVLRVVPHGRTAAQQHISCMNQLGEALRIDRLGSTQHIHLSDVDTLSVVFAHLSFQDLLSACQACVLWHLVSQRTSLLLQLQGGHWTTLEGLESPSFLKLLREYSHRLDRVQLQQKARAVRQMRTVCTAKEAKSMSMWGGTRPHMFTKAAGCTIMRTVQADSPVENLCQLSLGLHAARTKCFTALPGIKTHDEIVAMVKALELDGGLGGGVAAGQFEPLPTPVPVQADGKVTRIVAASSNELRQMSVALFRKYFSPDMYYIFPLLAHRQALFGLDFTSVNTWAIIHSDQPVGAVAWRFLTPPLNIEAHERGARGVLEVLFIGVWEHYRHHQCASVAVAALEAVARAQPGCAMLYVEIGHEQPKARKFWCNNGFELVNSSVQSHSPPEQLLFFENACLRFSDTEQYIKQLDG